MLPSNFKLGLCTFQIEKYRIGKDLEVGHIYWIMLRYVFIEIIIIYHDFLPTPRRDSNVKSDKTHTQSSRYTP